MGLAALALACKGEGLNYPTVVAEGRPTHCPEGRVVDTGAGPYPTPDAIRCSYADAQGKGETKVRGSVYGEQPGMFPGQPLEAVLVTVHEIESDKRPGKQLGKARTDAQGHFTLAAMLPSDTYLVIARDDEGRELARAFLTSDDRNPNVPKIQLLVPLDPEIKAAMERGEAGSVDGGRAGEGREEAGDDEAPAPAGTETTKPAHDAPTPVPLTPRRPSEPE